MEIYSLSELLAAVGIIIRDNLPDYYWVRAEISSISAKPGGHCFMELTESSEDDADAASLAAKVRASCWRNVWSGLSERFVETTGQSLQAGMRVLMLVKVEFHRVYGLSLVVNDIDPVFSLGDIARKRQMAIARLEKAGLLERQQSLVMPSLPRSLAVISSSSAAGYQDFVHQLETNGRSWVFQTTLFEALMQGDNAAASMADALQRCRRALSDGKHYDALVIIRGGGASTDLSCFDDYELAAQCAVFPLPLITGIGHTRDVSLVDIVAYKSLKTPTAVAEYFISLLDEQSQLLQDLAIRLIQTADRFTRQRKALVDNAELRVVTALARAAEREKMKLALLEKSVDMHSPEVLFRRGYSLVTLNGVPLRSISSVKDGDIVFTHLSDGVFSSKVIKG